MISGFLDIYPHFRQKPTTGNFRLADYTGVTIEPLPFDLRTTKQGIERNWIAEELAPLKKGLLALRETNLEPKVMEPARFR